MKESIYFDEAFDRAVRILVSALRNYSLQRGEGAIIITAFPSQGLFERVIGVSFGASLPKTFGSHKLRG